jgi:phage-related protein
MKEKFEVVFLKQAIDFVETLDYKTRKKIYYNIDKARLLNDPKLFKKLDGEIWEFRTQYKGIQYRLFAFWDKENEKRTLVISTHGIVKKVSKVPKAEIEKAEKIRLNYFDNKKAK